MEKIKNNPVNINKLDNSSSNKMDKIKGTSNQNSKSSLVKSVVSDTCPSIPLGVMVLS
jgi:hypothetical protein